MNINDLQRGNLLLIDKKYDAAIVCFLKHAEANHADRADAYAKTAECYVRHNILSKPVPVTDQFSLVSKGNLRSAEYYYKLALKENHAHFPSLKGLVKILPEGSEARLEAMEKCLRVQPDYLITLELGSWYFKVKNCQRAYTLYLEAQKLNPKDRSCYDCLQKVCHALGNENEASSWKKCWDEIQKRKRRSI